MKDRPRGAEVDESALSEITIGPDGRVFAFGITRPIVEVLRRIPTNDRRMADRLERIAGIDARAATEEGR